MALVVVSEARRVLLNQRRVFVAQTEPGHEKDFRARLGDDCELFGHGFLRPNFVHAEAHFGL